jgi:hypothetical protein
MPTHDRRRWGATALLAAFLVTTACHEEPAPVTTAKAFIVAAKGRNSQAVLDLADEKTVAYAQQAASEASHQIGGRRSVEPSEMLQVVDVDPRFAVAKSEVLSQTADAATVRLHGADEATHDVNLVLEQGEWKVSLPTPRPTASTTSEGG